MATSAALPGAVGLQGYDSQQRSAEICSRADGPAGPAFRGDLRRVARHARGMTRLSHAAQGMVHRHKSFIGHQVGLCRGMPGGDKRCGNISDGGRLSLPGSFGERGFLHIPPKGYISETGFLNGGKQFPISKGFE